MVANDPTAFIQDLIFKKVNSPNPSGQRYNNIARKNLDPPGRAGARQGWLLSKLGITDGYAPSFQSEDKYLTMAEDMMFRAHQLNQKAADLRTYRPVQFNGGPSQTGLQFPKQLIRQVRQEQQQQKYKGKKNVGAPVAGRFGDFVKAISGKESGGNYKAVNPDSGALGKYQIMPSNFAGPGGWDKEALGRDISTQQFLNNPALQEKIARHKLQNYYNQYGVRGAASAWYSGDPNKWKNKSPQGGYPSINAYVLDILRRMGLG